MNRPGAYSLGDFSIAGAVVDVGDWITDLDGMRSLTFQARLAWGSGGTSIKAYLQTSFDGGATPVDIACVTFTTTGKVALLNFDGDTPRLSELTPTDATLADDTALDGLLGDRLRVKLVTTGTYAGGTVLSARMVAR